MYDFDVLQISESSGSQSPRAGALGLPAVRLDVRITDIPRGPALTLAPEASVATAIAAMRRRPRGAAIVVRNHRPLGVVTERDLLGGAGAELEDPRSIPVASVMSPAAEPLQAVDTVAAALRSMCAQRQWCLPIVCGRGLFLGALDISDVSLWLRDRLTILSVDAALAPAGA